MYGKDKPKDKKNLEAHRYIWGTTPSPSLPLSLPPFLGLDKNSIWRYESVYDTSRTSKIDVHQKSSSSFHQKGLSRNDNDYVVDNHLYTPELPLSLSDILSPFPWSSYQFPGDTASTSIRRQDSHQQDLLTILNQERAHQSTSYPFPDIITNLSSDYGFESVNNNGVNSNDNEINTVASSSNDSLWFSTTPLRETDEVQTSKYRWLTDSVGFVRCNPFYSLQCAMETKYLTVIIQNIPWTISEDDIKKEFGRFPQPSPDKLVQNIHIIMDTSTGKTERNAFIQLIDCDFNRRLLEEQTTHVMLSRRVTYSICSEDDLLRSLYPRWPGTFQNGIAVPPDDGNSNDGNHLQSPLFITQRELQGLSNVCKMYKLNFNRKSGERPFAFMMSIVLNLPWHQERIVTTGQRDIIYESYKITAKYLAQHVTKQNNPFELNSVDRFVRPALQCCGFTPKQRRAILCEANIKCPSDLAYSIIDPVMPQPGKPFIPEPFTEEQPILSVE